MRQNYEVIRFVQQNGKCHVVMDCAEGILLYHYVLKNTLMEKKNFFEIIVNLAREVDCLKNSSGTILYPFLTPFNIMISENGEIALIKFSESYMQKYASLMQPFLPKDGTDNFVYSYGKILQFLLAKVKLNPKLTWKETRKLKRTIDKCLANRVKKGSLKLTVLVCLAFFSILLLREPEKIEEEPVIDLHQILQDYLQGKEIDEKMKIEEVVEDYEKELGEDMSLSERDFLLQIYAKLDTEYAKEQILKSSTILFEELVKNREVVANIYQERNELELARNEYQILVSESPSIERYLTLAELEKQCGRHREALNICERGSAVYPEGMELQLQYVRLLLSDLEYSRESKMEKLETFLSLYPMLENETRYEKLKSEYGY